MRGTAGLLGSGTAPAAARGARAAVLASDAFFPFPDSIELIAGAGIAAIVQPGGSKRDGEVIAAVDLPVLRNKFVVDRYQVLEARAHGAADRRMPR